MKKMIIVLLSFFAFTVTCSASSKSIKYYKTIMLDGVFETYEISQEEYDNVDEEKLRSKFIETAYKKMQIRQIGKNVVLDVEWKKTPVYRSYDVIAKGLSRN